MTTPSSSTPSSGCASSNASTPPNSLPTLPSRMQLASPSNQRAPSTSIFAPERLRAQVLRARPDVGEPAEAVLQAAVGVADHARVEAGAGHHGEALAVDPPDVDAARAARTEPISTACLDVLRDAEVGGEQVGGAGRDDRERRLVPGEDVDAALHHAVAAPHEDQLGARASSAFSTCFGALRLFGTSRQNDVGHAAPLEHAPQLGQAAAEGLAAWAITATRSSRRASASPACRARRAASPAARTREQRDRQRGESDQRAGGRVDRVVHAAVHPRRGDDRAAARSRASRQRSSPARSRSATRSAARARRRRRPRPPRGRTGSSG